MASLSQIMKKAFKFAKKVDPLGEKIRKNTEDLPGGSGALQAAFTSDQPSDPYGPQQGKFDIFAGGKQLSKSERARNVGRAIGTVAALYFGGAAMGGGEAAGAGATAGGGAATAGGTAAGAGAATGGITTGQAVTAGLAAQSLVEQRKAAKAAEEAMRQQSEAFDESLTRLRRDTPQTPSIDEARRRAEQSDAQRRKRGRRASILTGDTGVGFTPVSQRTLLGS